MPSAGLSRKYTCSMISPDGKYIFIGTSGGEICIYNIQSRVFKALLHVSVNGIWAIIWFNGVVFVGSGDGKVKKLVGQETKWVLDREVLLKGRVTTLSADPFHNEILAGTSTGNIYRIFPDDLSATLHTEGHVTPINDVAF